MNNFWMKLASLLIAVFLAVVVNFYFVSNDNNTSVLQFIVPVEVKNIPAEKMLLLPVNRQVEVTIQGPSLFVSKFASTNPTLKVSIPSEVKNKFIAPLRREDLKAPPEVQVVSIKPSEIEFTLDTRITKEVPVIVPQIGQLPENLKLVSIKAEPDKVKVSGPESEVKAIKNVESLPLDLREIRESGEQNLAVRVPGSMSDSAPRQISVNVTVNSVQVEAKYEQLAVEIRSLRPERFSLSPARVNLEVSGSKEAIKNLKPEEILPYVRLGEESKPGDKVKVGVDLPKGISLVYINPEKVDLIAAGDKPKAPAKTNVKK
ncbi:MAG: hypothetical protein DCC75_03375 [Proteobacteria bacterium]|nr:MAG: hypothetical protein DCC75_03375 [Pseudomonadota bacterium]